MLPKHHTGAAFVRIGNLLMYVGGAALVSIFAVVLLVGHWPEWLRGVQAYFALLGGIFGIFAIPIEIWTFIGPGAILRYLGEKLQGQ